MCVYINKQIYTCIYNYACAYVSSALIRLYFMIPFIFRVRFTSCVSVRLLSLVTQKREIESGTRRMAFAVNLT